MRLAGRVTRRVNMLVMLVVRVQMLMLQLLVTVGVFVALCEMQPDPGRHQ